jgi:hypothetical protein
MVDPVAGAAELVRPLPVQETVVRKIETPEPQIKRRAAASTDLVLREEVVLVPASRLV